jgi:hypothetical protein
MAGEPQPFERTHATRNEQQLAQTKGEQMSTRHCGRIVHFVAFGLAGSVSAGAQVPHNIILFVAESLPPASVDRSSTPTLARFRDEGVNFINSHADLPIAPSAQASLESFVAAAAAARSEDGGKLYSTAFIDEPSEATLDATLREFKQAHRPFVLVYKPGELPVEAPEGFENVDSGDADAGKTPMTSTSAPAVDHALAAIEATLKALALYDSTNVFVTAERGASATIWKYSETSPSLDVAYDDVPRGALPPGFLAIDLVAALQAQDPTLGLFDPDDGNDVVDWGAGKHPRKGNAIIAVHPSKPQVVIAARGGYDVIYVPEKVPGRDARRIGARIVEALLNQDYVSGIFIDEKRLGRMGGALSTKDIGLDGGTKASRPTIVVSFASVSIGCDRPTLCIVMIADTPLAEGREIPGGFSRAHTWNFMAARGPDFWVRTVRREPASNADVVRTLGELLGLEPPNGKVSARVLKESLRGSDWKTAPHVQDRVIVSKRSIDGLETVVEMQSVGSTAYFDAAGFPGWTVGIEERDADAPERGPRWDWPRPRSFTIRISPD